MEHRRKHGDTASHEQHDRWLTLVRSARWFRQRPTQSDTLRCGVCRVHFTPTPNGAATFLEERGAVILRACPDCEHLFATAPDDRRRTP
jgi:hypothetical protein